MFGLKLADNDGHRHYTGVSNTLILQNLRLLAEKGCRVQVRLALIPGATMIASISEPAEPLSRPCPGLMPSTCCPVTWKQDLQAGILDPEGAKELPACLWIKINNHTAPPPKVGVAVKESGTYNDFTPINFDMGAQRRRRWRQ